MNDKSVDIWNALDVFLGSILLEIECRINVYKYLIIQMKARDQGKEK